MFRQTSLMAYEDLQRDVERLNRQQLLVYKAISLSPRNDKQLSMLTGLPINVVTPRRGELVKMGLVVEAFKDKCPSTGRLSTFWRANRKEMEE
jgi:hypothetical protein